MPSILRQATVVRDGLHNAFTDLLFWDHCYWVSYRKGAGHVSADGQAVLAMSGDRERFREVARLKVPGDVRDPKMVPMDDGRLALIFPSYDVAAKSFQQFVAFSANGYDWEPPQPILDADHWLWRVTPHGGRYYGADYNWDTIDGIAQPTQLDFLVSDNMLHWEKLAQVGDTSWCLSEVGLHFFSSGEAWMVARSDIEPQFAYLCSAQPPYTQWETVSLGTLIHSPAIIEHQGKVYVAGRRHAQMEGDSTYPFPDQVSHGVWRLERGKVTPVLRIPATGDCSYPGFIVDPEGRVCMTYYSQHAYHHGVLPWPYRENVETAERDGQRLGVADVYFAELDLSG